MKNEVKLVAIIWKLAKGFPYRSDKGSIQPIDLLAYSVVFQWGEKQWGVWSQGEFLPLADDYYDALWLCIEWGIDEGRFNRLIDEINAL